MPSTRNDTIACGGLLLLTGLSTPVCQVTCSSTSAGVSIALGPYMTPFAFHRCEPRPLLAVVTVPAGTDTVIAGGVPASR
ncbi:hypothetical protein BKA70DRAFT_1320308 [Coprinopsis sp. MPI-PUGE-AT-0042]|nr:hypothetical protein BKA70DRAFT_1320308 [Coprinopsis sp. MPI-PUGE-AT-0042]